MVYTSFFINTGYKTHILLVRIWYSLVTCRSICDVVSWYISTNQMDWHVKCTEQIPHTNYSHLLVTVTKVSVVLFSPFCKHEECTFKQASVASHFLPTTNCTIFLICSMFCALIRFIKSQCIFLVFSIHFMSHLICKQKDATFCGILSNSSLTHTVY